MKNIFFLMGCLLLAGCSTSEKANSTIATDSIDSSMLSDTIPGNIDQIDSVIVAEVVKLNPFNENDSASYFILSNYFATDSILKPADVQEIRKTCAVLIAPTDEQVSELKEKLGDEKFFTVADDNSYYHGMAIEMLDSIDIEAVKAEKEFLRFSGPNSTKWELDIRKEGAPAWNLIFFRRGKEPKIVSITDMSHDAIIDYFKK